MFKELSVTYVNFNLKITRFLQLSNFSGFILRGAFGTTFQQLVCAQRQIEDCKECYLANHCAYSITFNPVNPQNSSYFPKNDQLPRPFFFYVEEEKQYFDVGEEMNLQLTLIGKATDYFPYFFIVLKELGKRGLGKKDREGLRGCFEINRITENMNGQARVLYSGENGTSFNPPQKQKLKQFFLPTLNNDFLRVSYITPLRVKWQKKYCSNIDFHILLRNILRRISALYYFSTGETLELDYRGLIERAEKIETKSSEFEWVEYPRYSTRKKEKMILGGVQGWADYEGLGLEEFYPFLQAAEILAVGKGTSFGFGKIAVDYQKKGG